MAEEVARAVDEAVRLIVTTKLPPLPTLDSIRRTTHPSQRMPMEALDQLQRDWGLRINLSSLYVGPTHCNTVSRLLILNRTVTSLDLSMCDMGTDAACHLFHCLLRNDVLQRVNISGNFIESKAAEPFAAYLKAPTCRLQAAHWACNSIGDDGVRAICESLPLNHSLQFLNLRANGISDDGAQMLLQAMNPENNFHLNTLWLRLNPAITDATMEKVTEMMVLKCPPELHEDVGKKKPRRSEKSK